MNNLPYRQRLSTKISLYFVISIILIVYVSSSLIYFKSYHMLVRNVGKKALKIAEYSAESIDVEKLKQLKTTQDMNKSYFKKLKSDFKTIGDISGANYLYILRKNENGKYCYIIESTSYTNDEPSQIGKIENINYPGFDDVMQGNTYIDNKIVHDKYGSSLSAYYPLKDKNGQIISFIGVDYNASDEYKEFQNLKITIFIISLIISIFAMIFGYILAQGISKPITKLTKFADEIANYNLNIDNINIKSNSEIGLLSNSFNKMCENIKFLVNNIKTTSVKLNTTSELLASSSEEIVASSEEIERTVQEIYSCANTQAVETNNCVEITNDLSNKIEDMSNILTSTSEYTNSMRDKNELGLKSIIDLSNSFKETIEATNIVGNKIEDLSDKSKSIDMIIETIKSISEQTNLLALNASIEAARAGEYGKGFCVVADEIRKLADQSSSATEEIQKIIADILQIINHTTSTMSNSKLAVSDTNKYLIQTTDVFNEIKISADNVIKQIQLLNIDIVHIEKDKNDVVRLIQNISKQAEEASFDTEKINESSQEQTTGMEEVASSIQDLNNMANSLSELIKVFKFQ